MEMQSIGMAIPSPQEYPAVRVEKLRGGYLVTVLIPNYPRVPPQYAVGTLEEVYEIIKKYMEDYP